jgi:hypothetical protein
MKTIIRISAFCFLLSALPGRAELTATLYPGYTFAPTEAVSIAKLNRLGRPVVVVMGTLSGTSALGPGTVVGTHLNATVVGWGTNGLYLGSGNNLMVSAANLAGTGLKASAPHTLAVNVDNARVIWDATGTNLTVNFTNYTLLTALTNGDVFTFYSVSTNASNRYGTNPAMRTVTYSTLLTSVSNALVLPGFTSGESNLVAGACINMAHGLTALVAGTNAAVTPRWVRTVLVCKTNDNGWLAGDELDAAGTTWDRPADGCPINWGANATNVYVVSVATRVRMLNRDTGEDDFSTLGRWKVKVICQP